MGRYRPPEPEKTAVITAPGFARLQHELNFLWKEKRPEVTARVAAAAALGDRSENADYIYGKRQLGEIDRRIRYLDKRIRTMQVVDRLPADETKIYFGAWVTLESLDDDAADGVADTSTYRLVGPDEIDFDPGYISIDSPMAKALIGKSQGDQISLVQAGKTSKILSFEDTARLRRYGICNVRYEPLKKMRQ
ncbi:MAG: transcription elongation factor GreB [Pseudomonadales bacterium]|nr:transcription elongation factor GreB [Pseudomonadales bacterium]